LRAPREAKRVLYVLCGVFHHSSCYSLFMGG
jgi:hypothetical protein